MNKFRLTFSIAATALILGCASNGKSSLQGPTSSAAARQEAAARPITRPAPVRSSRVLAEVAPRGSVPYDMQSMPLVCPEGKFIATQTRIAPTWPTVLAEHDAQVPLATRIEIYAIDDEGVRYVTSVDQPVVLGRSFNRDGFIVESPNADGSRWIGMAAWDTGQITWLVSDDAVNAFASLGRDGRLAWSRRAVDAPEDLFELVIRHGQHEWVYHSPDESWLMPTWTGNGDSLFALTLREGHLSAVFVNAHDEVALRQSRRDLYLARDAGVHTAHQTIGAQVNSPDLHDGEQFIFMHPARARMAVWQPRASTGTGLTFFDGNTFAAVMDNHEFALVTTERQLVRQHLRDTRQRSELIAGVQVPRLTNADQWRYILLTPQQNVIGVTAMHRF